MRQIKKNRYIVDLNPTTPVILLNVSKLLYLKEKYPTGLKKPLSCLKETHIK